MKILFPKQKIRHKRKEPKTTIYQRSPYFGTEGVVLNYRQAMAVYHKVQDFLDRWDVETEIDYREEEGDFTEEESANLRREMQDIVDEYRGVLDDDGHWNDVLMGVMDLRRAGYANQVK